MSFTVPRGGIRAGQTSGNVVEVDGTGGVVAEFGDRIAQVGRGIEQEALSRQATRLQIDMTRQLGDLRLEFEQMSDPDQIDAQWEPRVSELKKGFFDASDEAGRPRIHPKLAERVGLAFDDLSVKHGLAVGRHAVAARQNVRAAQFLQYSNEVVSQAATADRDTRETLLSQLDARVDEDLAAGLITPFEAAEQKITNREQATEAAAIAGVDGDPAAFLERADAGEFDDIDPVKLARYRNRAKSNITAAKKAAETEAERARKEQEKLVGDRLATISDIAGKGLTTAGEVDFLASPEAAAHPKWKEAMAAVALRDEVPNLAQKTPAELRDLLATERKKPIEAKFQAERVQVLEDLLAASETGWTGEPVEHARSINLAVPDLPDFDPQDPSAYAQGLASRYAWARARRDEGYTDDLPMFDADEAATFKALLSSETDAATRVALARTLNAALAQASPEERADILDDPVFGHVAGFIRDGGNIGTAREMFRGQEEVDRGNVKLPPSPERIDLVSAQLASLFGDDPQGARLEATVRSATDALYAARIKAPDPAGTIDEDVYAQALHEVMGGTGEAGSRKARGGVQELRDRLTLLPPGVNARAVEDALRGLGRVPSTMDSGRPTFATDPAVLQEALAEISRDGQPPVLNGEPVDMATLRDGNLYFVGYGRDAYGLVLETQTGPVILKTAEGNDYLMSLRGLLARGAP